MIHNDPFIMEIHNYSLFREKVGKQKVIMKAFYMYGYDTKKIADW